MANDVTRNPWILDTVATIKAAGLSDSFVKIKGIRWVAEGAAAGNNARVTDGNDRDIWESVAAGANHVEADKLNSDISHNGFKVAVLDAGKLYVDIG